MIIKTLNSEYIVKGKELWRNGELYTDDIRFIGGMYKGFAGIYDGIPEVGDMLYIEYYQDSWRSIRTSTITEVIL